MKRLLAIAIILTFSINLNCKKKQPERNIQLKGTIIFVTGNVAIIDEKGLTKNAKIGNEISQSDKIKTSGSKSIVEIYIEENLIKIFGNSIIEAQSLFKNSGTEAKEIKVFVEEGSIFSRVKKKLNKSDLYQVSTPTTTVAVRGTDFFVSEKKRMAKVTCLSGEVEVTNKTMVKAEPVILKSNQETDILPDREMVKKKISAHRLKDLIQLADVESFKNDIKIIIKENLEKSEETKSRVDEIMNYLDDQEKINTKSIKDMEESYKKTIDEKNEDGRNLMNEMKEDSSKLLNEMEENNKKFFEEQEKNAKELEKKLDPKDPKLFQDKEEENK